MTEPSGSLRAARPTFAVAGEERRELAENLLGLVIAEDTAGMARCEAHFANWGDTGQGVGFLFFDRRTLEFGRAFEVRLGRDALFSGRIMALEAHFPQGRPPEIVTLAEDRFQDLRMARRTRSFADQADADVFRTIAGDHGLRAEVDVTGPRHRLLAQVNQSDLAFMRERARLLDAELWLEGTTLHVAAHSRRRNNGPELSYGGDLREFSVLADLAEQWSAVVVSGWDVAAKRQVRAEAGESAISAELQGGLSGARLLQQALGRRTQSFAHTVPLGAEAAQSEADALFRLSARRFLVGQGLAQTSAALRVGASVNLRNLGPLFSGRYYLSAVRHLFDGDQGLRTAFTAERPFLGQ